MSYYNDTTLPEAFLWLAELKRDWLRVESLARRTARALDTGLTEVIRLRRATVDGPHAWVHHLPAELQGSFRHDMGQVFNDETGGWYWPDCACHGCQDKTGCVWPGSVCDPCGVEGPCPHFPGIDPEVEKSARTWSPE